MSILVDKGVKWGKTALALKLGKTAVKRGGLLGIGMGAVAGAGYLAYNFYTKKKKAAQHGKIKRIDNIENNHPEVEGDKNIVI